MCDICGQHQVDHSNRFFNLNSSSSGTNQSLANYLTTGFWDDSGFTGSKFNLSNSGVHAKNGSITYNHTSNNFDNNGLSADRRFLVDEAFKYFELITGIDFQSTSDLDADYQFGDFDNNAYSQVFSSSGNTNYVTVNVNSSWNNSANGFGNYTYHTFLHEIGHGLGLGHQGNYNSEGDYPDDVTFANDSWQSSIMSYFSQQDNTSIDASYAHLSSFMVADLIAIDDLYSDQGYGLINALSGDTIYGFNTNINASDSQIFNEMSTWISSTAFTITDGSGNDTLDFSEFANKQTIDLRPSEKNSTSLFSSDIAGYTGNLVISPGTIIENAIGGNANDTITGNSNSNTLTGNGGADTINGGDGDDILHGNGGADTINGEGGNDTLNGNNASDILNGGIGDDILNGNNGDDNLNGGSGDDTMVGGTGDDTYTVDSTSDVVTENSSQGTDLIQSSVTFTASENVENLTLTGSSNINATGNSLNNTLTGNFGNNVLDGREGNDTVIFSGDYINYSIDTTNGILVISDNRDTDNEGIDSLKNIEEISFNDTVKQASSLLSQLSETGKAKFSVTGNDLQKGTTLTASKSNSDPNGDGTFSYSWKTSTDQSSWNEAGTNSTYTISEADEGKYLRLDISYTDGNGNNTSILGTYDSQLSTHTVNNKDLTAGIIYSSNFDINNSPTNIDIGYDGQLTLGTFFDNHINLKKDLLDLSGDYGTSNHNFDIWLFDEGTYAVKRVYNNESIHRSGPKTTIENSTNYSNQLAESNDYFIDTYDLIRSWSHTNLFIPQDNGDAIFEIVGTTSVGESLIIREFTADPDGTGALSYVWQSSSDETTWTQIGTDSTYTLTSEEEGKKVRAIISYTDGNGFSESVTSILLEIKTDDGDAVFSISGTTSVGESLSVSESTPDPDGGGTLTYAWESSSDNSFWTQIGSNSSYALSSSEQGKYVRALITYTDGQGFSESVTTSSVELIDDGDSVFEIAGTTSVGELLSISVSTADPDGTGTLSYVWQSSSDETTWSQIGTDSTYTLTSSEEGKKIRAILSYTDGHGFSETVNTSSIDIKTDDGDAVFEIDGTTLVGELLNISISSLDPDGIGTLSYVWQSSSDETTWNQIGTDSTYTLTSEEEGKQIRVIVSYTDGQGFSETIETSTVDLIDDGDAVFAIYSTGAVVRGDNLSITESTVDPDGTGTLSYVWQSSSDETTWSQIGTDSTYTLTSSEEGKKVRAIVSYTDGQGFAEEVTSSSIDINQRIYELSTSINVPQEEYTLTTTVNTENVIEGSTLYWSLSGTNITLSDFSDGSLTGSGTVNSDGTFSFKHSIASDGETEGYETIDIKLFSDSDRTTQVAATEILIRDAALEEQIAEVVEDVNGVKKIVSQLVQGQNYTLSHIRDYDGNLHAGSNDEETAAAYKYQHTLDINGDGIEEAIYTNMKSGRWVTASINPETGKIDYSDYGKKGTTRVVGIYDDPLIAVGLENNGFLPDGVTPAPAQFGATGSDRYVDLNGDGDFDDDNEDRLALNSQVRFQNDLKIDNLVAKLSNDFDSDGVREVFWRTSDNSAYLRALMHADGNIRYANYQNEQQMTEYLTDNGFDESTISEIIA